MRLIDADAFDKRLVRLGTLSIKSALDEEPTIEAELIRHGKWVYGDYYDVGDVCSECDWDSGSVPCDLHYCPNCGAKMDLKG